MIIQVIDSSSSTQQVLVIFWILFFSLRQPCADIVDRDEDKSSYPIRPHRPGNY